MRPIWEVKFSSYADWVKKDRDIMDEALFSGWMVEVLAGTGLGVWGRT